MIFSCFVPDIIFIIFYMIFIHVFFKILKFSLFYYYRLCINCFGITPYLKMCTLTTTTTTTTTRFVLKVRCKRSKIGILIQK